MIPDVPGAASAQSQVSPEAVPSTHQSFDDACQALFGSLHNQVNTPEAMQAAQDRRHLTVHEMREYLRRLSVVGVASDLLSSLPQHIIHIAGTKGKGSTASLCEAVCRVRYQQHTGLFTSPHLVDIRERIRVNGQPVSKDVFAQAYWKIRTALEAYKNEDNIPQREVLLPIPTLPGYFRMLTLVALYIFAYYQNPKLDVMILEVGMGGRYDATNLLDITPNGTSRGVTLIDYDHERVLGNTLEQIAWEKGGIFLVNKVGKALVTPRPDGKELAGGAEENEKQEIQSGVQDIDEKELHVTGCNVCFALESNTPNVIELLQKCARNEGRGSVLQLVGPQSTPELLKYLPPQLGLAGDHQRHNALLAVAMVRHMMKVPNKNANDNETRETLPLWHQALAHVSWPGRCQTVPVPNRHLTLRIDGAHTPQSIRVGFEWFQACIAESTASHTALLFFCNHEKNPVPLFLELLSAQDNETIVEFDVVCFCAPNAERPSPVPLRTAKELLKESGHLTAEEEDTPTTRDGTSDWKETLQTVWKHLSKTRPHHVVTTANNVSEALKYLEHKTSSSMDSNNKVAMEIFVTGSLYLAGSVLEAISWVEADSPGGLRAEKD